jgi:hypothetical protein
LCAIPESGPTRTALSAEKHATQLGAGILEDEISVTGTLQTKIRNLTGHASIGKPALQLLLELLGQFTHRLRWLLACLGKQVASKTPLGF